MSWFLAIAGSFVCTIFILVICACAKKNNHLSDDVEKKNASDSHSQQNMDVGSTYAEVGGGGGDMARALPELPAGRLACSPNVNDGVYDFIAQPPAQPPASPQPPQPPDHAVARHANFYEKVDSDDQDSSTYGRMKSDNSSDGHGGAEYARIDEHKRQRGASFRKNKNAEHSENLDATPPVPEKLFDILDDEALARSDPDVSSGALAVAALRGAPTLHSSGATVLASGALDRRPTKEEVERARKDARYSAVTARESIASLRARQALPPRHHDDGPPSPPSPPSCSATYETVNYAAIAIGSDQKSQTSDLYAEIASEINSTRSSMYARLSELHTERAQLAEGAPTPPPVNILKQLPSDVHAPGDSVVATSLALTGDGATLNHIYSPQRHQVATSPHHLYSMVNKLHEKSSGPSASGEDFFSLPVGASANSTQYAHNGTVPLALPEDLTSVLDLDPDYDTVLVQQERVARPPPPPTFVPFRGAARRQAPGVATGVAPWVRRDHIYQEIGEVGATNGRRQHHRRSDDSSKL